MSTAALDRQYRWRCRLQDLNPHLQPPTPKAQLPKPSASPFPPRLQLIHSSSNCFPLFISPLLESSPFQFCFLPPTTSHLQSGVANSLTPQTSLGIQSVDQGKNLDSSLSVFTDHKSSTPVHLQPPLFQSNSLQNVYVYPLNNQNPVIIQVSNSLPDLPLNHNTKFSSCNSEFDSSVVSSSSWTTSTSMHAQTPSENFAVSAVESHRVSQDKCHSQSPLPETSLSCRKHYSGSSSTHDGTCRGCGNESVMSTALGAGTININTNYSPCPSMPFVKNLISSSLPRCLESYTCQEGAIPSIVTSVTHDVSSKESSAKSDIVDTKSFTLESKRPCSKSDSHLSTTSLLNCNYSSNPSKENQGAHTEGPAVLHDALKVEDMGESLTTEEESSSFDSGQDESSDSSKKCPCPRSRKKRPGGTHTQQLETHSPEKENLNLKEQSEEDLTAHDNDLSAERKGGLSFSKSNSRGGNGGKYKVSGCFNRRRLVDDEGYIRRAACICLNKEEDQVLLVSSKKDRCAWLIPGGGLEVGEDSATAAVREAWEEAGVLGHIARYLGLFESYHHSGLKKHRTAVYIFKVTEEHSQFPEARLGRTKKWFSLEEALRNLTLHRPVQSTYLQFMMMSNLEVTAKS